MARGFVVGGVDVILHDLHGALRDGGVAVGDGGQGRRYHGCDGQIVKAYDADTVGNGQSVGADLVVPFDKSHGLHSQKIVVAKQTNLFSFRKAVEQLIEATRHGIHVDASVISLAHGDNMLIGKNRALLAKAVDKALQAGVFFEEISQTNVSKVLAADGKQMLCHLNARRIVVNEDVVAIGKGQLPSQGNDGKRIGGVCFVGRCLRAGACENAAYAEGQEFLQHLGLTLGAFTACHDKVVTVFVCRLAQLLSQGREEWIINILHEHPQKGASGLAQQCAEGGGLGHEARGNIVVFSVQADDAPIGKKIDDITRTF